ncbi:DnaB-like helicase N-terminal domain-containing protein [Xanthomonas oryzae]|uniref:DNA helicase DnaB-like N-terminal domain-containing protein n=1 Tax=Xanthomonas oryzae pv. oryzae TaxID=64187 RepID=A0AAJ5MDW5_XANOO|nr:hypothetical protein IXO792_14690 [Xanthomonas oryzae pv. oryzae]UXW28964.1 hypothetical protein IXO639_008560 [Xanthomonas oryzae pv. oryzae]UXW32755.1 hypothetical protein IXO644_009155 [Xanthomonas oryzae pv. oryzae]
MPDSRSDLLQVDDFADRECRALFEAIKSEIAAGRPSDVVTLGERHPVIADVAFQHRSAHDRGCHRIPPAG